jgi:hypothetical protein
VHAVAGTRHAVFHATPGPNTAEGDADLRPGLESFYPRALIWDSSVRKRCTMVSNAQISP